jgi:hypothetical protein
MAPCQTIAAACAAAAVGALAGCGMDLHGLLSFEVPTCEDYADAQSSWWIDGFEDGDLVDLPGRCPPDCAGIMAVAQLAPGETRRLRLVPQDSVLECTDTFYATTWISTNGAVASVTPDGPFSVFAEVVAVAAGETSVHADGTFRGKGGAVRAYPYVYPRGSGSPVMVLAIRVRAQ